MRLSEKLDRFSLILAGLYIWLCPLGGRGAPTYRGLVRGGDIAN